MFCQRATIYLSIPTHDGRVRFPSQSLPYQNLGFSLVGLSIVSLPRFPLEIVTVERSRRRAVSQGF